MEQTYLVWRAAFQTIGVSGVGRTQYAQVSATCLTGDRAGAAGPGRAVRRTGCLAHGVGQGFEVVAGGAGGRGAVGEAYDVPAARGRQALRVLGAQVIAVGFGVGGERAENCGRIGVDVRQCRDGRAAARGARTATYKAHDVGRYRTLDRAATTLPQVTPPCRGAGGAGVVPGSGAGSPESRRTLAESFRVRHRTVAGARAGAGAAARATLRG